MHIISLSEISKIIQTCQFLNHKITGYAVDSRLLKNGDLFFALPGAKVDGHEFLKVAAEKEASGAIVNENYRGPDFGLNLIHSKDVLETLQDFAKLKLELSKAKVIAVTGSLGKTTTKDFLSDILKTKYKVAVSPGNNNSQIGLPLSILNHVSVEHEFIILEMGMTLPGQIKQLVEIAPPFAAIVTIVALVHACNFDSLEEIARAKAEIFSHPATKIGLYHYESNAAKNNATKELEKSGACQKKSFSTTMQNADYYLKMTSDEMIICQKNSAIDAILPKLMVPGLHNTHNFLAAASMAHEVGMTFEEIKLAIPQLKLPEKRLQHVEKFGALFINDAYNASEVSIKAALDSLPQPENGGKRIAVLGEIVELGKFSKMCHLAVGEYALDKVDCMLCYGNGTLPILDSWKKANRQVVWGKERGDVIEALRQMLKPGDVVLLKGSRATSACKVLEEL